MVEKTSPEKVGLFVLGGLTLLVGSLLIFGGGERFFAKHAEIKTKFSSIQGLAPGSIVSLSGLEIGNVTAVEFDEAGSLVATLQIEAAHLPRITDQSIASLRTQGALGDKYIYITVGPAGSTPLNPGDVVKSEQPTDILELISNKAGEMGSLVDVIRELNQLLQNLNAGGRSAIFMANLVDASNNIKKLLDEPNIRESFGHLKNVLRKIDNGQGTLGTLINDRAAHDRLMEILGDSPRNRYLKPLIREAIKQNEQPQR